MVEGELGGIISNVGLILAGASAIISTLLIVYKKVVKPIYNHFKNWYDMMDKIDIIFDEVTPNDGKSIKDRVNKTHRGLTFVSARLKAHLADTQEASFETDEKGNCNYVNRTYTRLVQRSPSEVMGQGWQNCILEEDREYVIQSWKKAINEGRELSIKFRFETPSGKVIPIKAASYKMTNEEGEIIGYLGKIKVLEETKPIK